jgi:predicted nucleic acid-binding protein
VGLIVDASVCAKWLFDEEHSMKARRLLASGQEFRAPYLLPAEIGNIAWKKCLREEVAADEAEEALATFRKAPISFASASGLARSALAIALELRHPFYDCLYLALARRHRTRVVTADKRLRNKLAGKPEAALLLWIEDVP